jgi:UDP:flavonoid glycosyltransferase YjiC (YdhE family)
MSEKKVFVISFPLLSHLNGILNIINELVNTHHVRVVTYGLSNFESLVIKTGSEFRAYVNFDDMDIREIHEKKTGLEVIAPLMQSLLTLTNMNLLKIACEIDKEKPALILLDIMSLHGKWIIRYLEKNNRIFRKNKFAHLSTTSLPPEIIIYSTGFANQRNIFPDKNDTKILYSASCRAKYFSFFKIIKLLIRTKMLSNKYGLDFIIPIDEMFVNNQKYKHIIFTIPEIQPKSNLMHTNIKYVGPCLSEHLRNNEQRLTNDSPSELRIMIEKFNPINPSESFDDSLNKVNNRLLYVSFGTVFDSGTEAYLKIIEAINLFNNQSIEELNKKGIKINKLNAIMSVGKMCYQKLEMIFNQANYSLPKEIVLVPSAPQIEILKRASLFLTHTGFGSMHESLYFGVPMIAMPISADQPLNARYLENELHACVCVNFRSPNSLEIQNSIEKVLIDQKYHRACLKYSKLLKNSNGAKNGAELINSML